jgi:hypothetical protein
MTNELAAQDPNQIKNNLVVRNPSEFAKPDKTRQQNGTISGNNQSLAEKKPESLSYRIFTITKEKELSAKKG